MPPCRGCQHSWADEAKGCKPGSHQSHATESLDATSPQPPPELVRPPEPRCSHKLAHVSSSLLLTHCCSSGSMNHLSPRGSAGSSRLSAPRSPPGLHQRRRKAQAAAASVGVPHTGCVVQRPVGLRTDPQPPLQVCLGGYQQQGHTRPTNTSPAEPTPQRERKTQLMPWNQPS